MALRAGTARKWKRLVVASMVMVVLSSCRGGGDSGRSASTPTTVAAPGSSTTLRPVDTSFTGQNNAQFCALAKTYSERSGTVGKATTPDQLRAGVQEARTAVNELAGAAPAEIKGDAQTLAKAFNLLFTELERANFDPSKVSLTALSAMQAPEFAQATARFEAYTRTVCGLS